LRAKSCHFPHIINVVTRAQTSEAAAKARTNIAEIGELLNAANQASISPPDIFHYCVAVTELYISFLEQIRDEVCLGLNAFHSFLEPLANNLKPTMEKTVNPNTQSLLQVAFSLSGFVLSSLHRIAYRLHAFYNDSAAYSIYAPVKHRNAARARWQSVSRHIFNGSFFVLASDNLTPHIFNHLRKARLNRQYLSG
jgi:hypothetical protein